MADYAQTTTFDLPHAERISRELGMITGKCDVTNYNTTGAEITDITGKFKSLKRVICDGFSDNLFGMRWDTTDKCFHAFSESDGGAGTAFQEEANDTDIGEINFIAIGTI